MRGSSQIFFCCLHCPFFKSLDVALAIDLDEFSDSFAVMFSHLRIGADYSRDGYDIVTGEKIADNSYAADIFIPVFLAVSQSLAKVVPYHVSIKDFHLETSFVESLANQFGKSGFARTGQAGEPDCKSFWHEILSLLSAARA